MKWRSRLRTTGFASMIAYAPVFAAEIPSQVFSINSATVGVTTLDEVQKTYGPAKPSKVSKADEADVNICYAHLSDNGTAFLIFESGVMGGFKQLTGFRITNVRPRNRRVLTKVDLGALEAGNGVRLGQDIADFKRAIPVEFKRHGAVLSFESVDRRAATEEELKRLRARWPGEKQDYFDVTTNLSARFKDDRLIDFYIHRIESY